MVIWLFDELGMQLPCFLCSFPKHHLEEQIFWSLSHQTPPPTPLIL